MQSYGPGCSHLRSTCSFQGKAVPRMTSSTAIFWPVLAQVLLTYVIYVIMSSRRIGAVKSGLARPSDFKVPSVEPEPSATAARSLSNQFELPVLFFAASLSLFVTGGAGTAAI